MSPKSVSLSFSRICPSACVKGLLMGSLINRFICSAAAKVGCLPPKSSCPRSCVFPSTGTLCRFRWDCTWYTLSFLLKLLLYLGCELCGHKQQVVFRRFDVHVQIRPTGLVVRSFKETVRDVTSVSFYSPFFCKSLSMAMTFLNFSLSLPPFASSSVSVRYMLWFNFILV